MTYSKYTDIATDTFQKSARNPNNIGFFQLHHSATTDGPGVVNMMTSGSRQVSANYVIYTDGTIVGVVPEEYRAWTSGSPTYDSQAITFEIANSAVGGTWPVSGESHKAVARVIADAAQRYGIKLDRWTVYGHGEMLDRWGVSYATACPGGLDIDWIVSMANDIINGGDAPQEEDDDMIRMYQINETGTTEGGFQPGRIWAGSPQTGFMLLGTKTDTAPGYPSGTDTYKALGWAGVPAYIPATADQVKAFIKQFGEVSGLRPSIDAGSITVDNTAVIAAIGGLPTKSDLSTLGANIVGAIKALFAKAGS